MKIVLSGASGLLGSALVPALRAEGHDVVTLVRREPLRAGEIAWDPAAGTIDAVSLAGIDAVVCLNGATIGRRWTSSRKREILDSRASATALLARTAAELDPRPSVFVCAGAVGIYGDRGDEILTEESELGTGFLADVAKAWAAASDPAREAGIRVVTFRQGIVLSGEGGVLEPMLRPFKLGLGGRVGSGRQWWSWVATDDLVAAYSFALRSTVSGAVNLGSPNPVTNLQFTNALGRALHRPTVFPFPALVARTVFGEMAEELLLASQRALPARLLDDGFEFAYPEVEAALERALAK